MNPHVSEILKAFGLSTHRSRKPHNAKLAQVYLVGDRYILRSRPLETDTRTRFAAECDLYAQVAGLTGFRFPLYERSGSGACFVIKEGCFWTLHKRIPGRPLGNWFELHRVDPSVNRQVLNALRRLHNTTAGCFDEKIIDRTRLLELVSPALAEAPNFLSISTRERLQTAHNRVARFCSSYPSKTGCFVHGDFHHGNILAHKGRIVGFIDLDWCRVSSPYEDLAFTLMMLLRDYENWSHTFRWPIYRETLEYYGFNGDAELLHDYLILYALFDYFVFKYARFDEAKVFFEYQTRFLETVCRKL